MSRSSATRRKTASKRWVSAESRPEDGSSSSSTVGVAASARPSSTSRATPSGSPTAERSAIPVEAEQLDQLVDGLVLRLGRRTKAAHGEDIGQDPALGVLGPMGDHQMVADRHAGEQFRVLERAGQTAGGPQLRTGVGDVLAVEQHPAHVGRSSPDSTPNRVLLPAPLGPTRPDDAGRWAAARLTSRTATSPPKRTVTPTHSSRACPVHWLRLASSSWVRRRSRHAVNRQQ